MSYEIFMQEHEKRLLIESIGLVSKNNYGLPFVEIGSAVGGSTAVIARTIRDNGINSKLVAVDPCSLSNIGGSRLSNQEWVASKTGGKETDQRKAIMHSTKEFKDIVDLKVATSADVRALWTGPIAWVLIDGNHSYQSAFDDLSWSDFLATDGVLVMHDVGGRHPGPTKALRQWWACTSSQWNWWSQKGSLIVLKRKS